jgi:hypothetical protein
LEVTTFNDDQTVIAHEKTLERVYQDDMMADFNKLITDETNLDATVISNKGSIHTIENQTKLESVGAIVSGEILAHQRITEEEVREKQAVANIVAATRLTASLEHIIG